MREYPQKLEAVQEMARSLSENSMNLDHAASVVSHILESSDFSPTPKQIRESAFSVKESFYVDRTPKCSICQGDGYLQCWQLVTYRQGGRKDIQELTEARYRELLAEIEQVPGVQMVVSGVRHCGCGKGHAMKQGAMGEQAHEPEPVKREKRPMVDFSGVKSL